MKNLLIIVLAALCSVGCLIGCSPSSTDFEKKGEEALGSGDNVGAVLHLKSAVASNASSLKARELLEKAYERVGDFQAAEQQLRKQVELGGDKNIAIPKIASWLVDRNENQALVKEFSEIKLDSSESNALLVALVSMAYAGQRRLPEAERVLAKAGAVNAATQLAAAQIQFNKGFVDKGKVLLDDSQRLADENNTTPWWVWRGIARGWQGLAESKKSLLSFDAALKALPSHFGIKGELGEYLMALEQVDQAKGILKDLKSTAPKYYRTALLEALVSIDAGRQDEAYELATRVLAQVPDSESASLIAANIDLARNNVSTAENRVQALLSRTPYSLGGQRLSAIIEAKKGNSANAERILEKTLLTVGNNPSLMVELAQQKLNLGKTAEARKLLEAAIATKPDSVAALATLSDLLLRSGKSSEAAAHLKKALSSSKPEIGSMQILFNLAIKTKQYDQALIAIEKTQSARPSDPAPTLWKAILAKEKGDAVAANALLLSSLDQSPTFYPALSILKAQSIVKSTDLGVTSEFEKRLLAATKAKPKDARIYLDLLALRQKQKLPAAELTILGQKFVGELPEAVNLRKAVAEMLLQNGQKKAADDLIQQGFSGFASAPGMLELAARWSEASGQNAIALTRYDELSKLFPENINYLLKRGQLMFATGKQDDGIEIFKKAVYLRPEDDFANRELAFAYFKQGKKEESFLALTTYGRQSGKAVSALLATADVQYFAGDFSGSLKSIEKAITLEPSTRTIGAKIRFLDAKANADGAEKTLTAWLKANPNDAAALLFAATRSSQKDQPEATVSYLSRLLKLTPGNPYLLNDLAFAQATLGQKQALQAAEQANATLPDQPLILDTLAFAQMVNGRMEDAEKTLRGALSTDPDALAPLVRLAELLKAKNDSKEAKRLVSNLDLNRLPKGYLERVKAI
jgi:cellulose synthase operon protein C